MLYQLCELGLKPLVFTLDNGFISDEPRPTSVGSWTRWAPSSLWVVRRHMNEIFVDSLIALRQRLQWLLQDDHTLATNLASEKASATS